MRERAFPQFGQRTRDVTSIDPERSLRVWMGRMLNADPWGARVENAIRYGNKHPLHAYIREPKKAA